jgi:hypothetical protein
MTFADPALADLCNSARRLRARWGSFGVDLVGRRLIELASARDLEEAECLPGATVVRGEGGGCTVTFQPHALEVVGELLADDANPTSRRERVVRFRILQLSLNVSEGSKAR